MSNYTKATNFAIKDGLVTTDPAKIIKGTEIDNEYNAISNAISSKADVNSPSLTGTPTAPTATTGSNTTQLATTAYVKQEITAQGLGNIATQNKNAIDITGGTIVGITDLAVADGGTGASTAANARTNLGVTATGADTTYAYRANNLSDLASASTARTNLGLGTIATQNSNSVSISGGSLTGVSITGITDIVVADGGTGVSTIPANAVVLGNGTSAIQTVAPGTSGNLLTSNGTTWTSATPTVVKGLGIGGEVWNNVTGSRAFNTQYTNSRSYPIAVSARTTCSTGSSIDMYVDGVRISYFNWQFNGCGSFGGGFIIVPPGKTYQLNSGQGLDNWVELY